MNQTDLPEPVKEDIANLQMANSELTNRLLELEQQVKLLEREAKAEKQSHPTEQKQE